MGCTTSPTLGGSFQGAKDQGSAQVLAFPSMQQQREETRRYARDMTAQLVELLREVDEHGAALLLEIAVCELDSSVAGRL